MFEGNGNFFIWNCFGTCKSIRWKWKNVEIIVKISYYLFFSVKYSRSFVNYSNNWLIFLFKLRKIFKLIVWLTPPSLQYSFNESSICHSQLLLQLFKIVGMRRRCNSIKALPSRPPRFFPLCSFFLSFFSIDHCSPRYQRKQIK